MNNKHTAGEWTIESKGNLPKFIWGKDATICEIHDPYSGEEMEANAKLIAAAPDMLNALEYVINWHRQHDSGEGELFGLDYVTTCISAMLKATS